jgi:hypothetical protein
MNETDYITHVRFVVLCEQLLIIIIFFLNPFYSGIQAQG